MLQEPKPQPRTLQIGWAVPAPVYRPLRTRWEYLRIETRIEGDVERVFAGGDSALHDLPIAEALGTLGGTDWELTSIVPRGDSVFVYTFKRPIAHP